MVVNNLINVSIWRISPSLVVPLLLAGALFAFADRAYAAANCGIHYCVSGTISATTTWATTTAAYVIQRDLTVDFGVTLTINPNVIVNLIPM